MVHRACHKDSWGSRELAEGRDAVGHIPMELGCCWDAVARAGALWGQPLLKLSFVSPAWEHRKGGT